MDRKKLLIEAANSCSLNEFLEEKLKRYLKELTKLERSNLYDAVLSEVEKSLITIVLKGTEGNQLRAAKTLGINRNTLRAKIKEYKIRI
jgi:DNA-binding protein Fis